MKSLLVLVVAAGVARCTPQQAQTAETVVPIVTAATCQILEDVANSPLVTLLCNAVDGNTGAAVPQQKVQVDRQSDIYTNIKSAPKPAGS